MIEIGPIAKKLQYCNRYDIKIWFILAHSIVFYGMEWQISDSTHFNVRPHIDFQLFESFVASGRNRISGLCISDSGTLSHDRGGEISKSLCCGDIRRRRLYGFDSVISRRVTLLVGVGIPSGSRMVQSPRCTLSLAVFSVFLASGATETLSLDGILRCMDSIL